MLLMLVLLVFGILSRWSRDPGWVLQNVDAWFDFSSWTGLAVYLECC